MAKFCGKCGSPLNDTAVFCGGCGAKIPVAAAAPAQPSYTPVTPDPATWASVPAAYVPPPATASAAWAPVPTTDVPPPAITPDPATWTTVSIPEAPPPSTNPDPAAWAQVPASYTPPPAAAQAPPAFVPAPAAFSNVSAPLPLPAVTPKSGSGLRTFLIVAAVCLLIVIGLGVAGAIYAVHFAKEKAQGLLKQIVPSSASSASSPSHDGEPGAAAANAPLPPPAASSFSAWQPTSSRAPSPSGPAPLKVGMLVVTAVAEARGDYESMKQIVSIDASGTTLSYHSDKPKAGTGSSGSQDETSVRRKVLTEDLNSAHDYAEVFGSTDPQSFPGTTAISASREVFSELQQKGATPFSFRPEGLKGAIGNVVSRLSSIAGIDKKDLGDGSLDKLSREQCNLQKEGNGLFAFPVLLNAQPTTLPAVRAGCMTDDGPAEFYILDQPDYPLMLSWKLGSGSQLQVIKITYPTEPQPRKTEVKPAPSAIEEQLKEKKKVDIYGIYFDFASDHLKPESTPVLEEIAGVLTSNPEWKLTVSGHTDNVGGDPYNLDLSKRRAAAVKLELVTRYHITPERLSTDGFGASRPVDTNDTLAGRARNRRVELTRE
jgi:outer membrane protein OmpA-like peptidoglycan-associated protein